MKITWIGHSCFLIESEGYRAVIDPYTDGSVPGLERAGISADMVLCSHEHGDHNGRGEIALHGTGKQNPFTVEVIDTFHDEVQGAKRGKNKIHIIHDGKIRIAHFGDLGCELTKEQTEKLYGADTVLVPVGGFYTIDAEAAAELIQDLSPRIVIPMHYRDDVAGFGYGEIDTVEAFTKKKGQEYTAWGSELDTGHTFDTQVIVMQPLRKKG